MSVVGAVGIMGTAVVVTILMGLALVKPLRNWQWVRQHKFVRMLGIFGVIGSVLAAVFIFRVGDTFGFPGSSDYFIYERFNRSMAMFLFLQSCAILAFLSVVFEKLSPFSQRVAAVMFAGWISMVVGTAAEFWLFSDLPYAEPNMRSFSFSLFSIGSLVAGISMMILGARMLLRRTAEWYFGLILIFYLPVDIALFIRGDSIFLTSAIGAAVLGILLIIRFWGSAPSHREPA
jgi:hypothetical protein